jgi:hypothetical protein
MSITILMAPEIQHLYLFKDSLHSGSFINWQYCGYFKMEV